MPYERIRVRQLQAIIVWDIHFVFELQKNLLTNRPQAGKLLKFVGKFLYILSCRDISDSQCEFVRSVFSFDVNDLQQLEMLPSPVELSTKVAFE